MKKSKYLFGTVSHGTMREEDLIPAFLSTIEYFSKAKARKLRRELKDIEKVEPEDDRLDQMAYFLNETLFDALDSYAAPYFYFGSHPGDGCDYGFWLSDEALEYAEDLLKVSDLSEVPKDYRGEILLVNDHGNTSLYVKQGNGHLKEVWAVV